MPYQIPMAQVAKTLPLTARGSAATHQETRSNDISDDVRLAESHDLVFAVVGHAGSGTGQIAKKLAKEIEGKGFQSVPILLSRLLGEAARSKNIPVDTSTPHSRTSTLQSAGGILRERMGSSIAAALAIREIAKKRSSLQKTPAFILDSIKHPAEIELLRSVYKNAFYLVGVVCHDDIRARRLELKYKSAPEGELQAIRKLDEADPDDEGQQVRNAIHLSDFFVCNDADFASTAPDPVADAVSRFVRLVTSAGIERPDCDECGMYAAWGASLRSACLSRQVGAAILDRNGNLLATGANEVPKAHGGVYDASSDLEDDSSCPVPIGRCFQRGICHSEKKKDEIYRDIIAKLAPHLRDPVQEEGVIGALKATRVGSLIEFSRAVHAEMDAIVSLARRGTGSTQGATLYCRTYPCHTCARHIVASGIREVIYIEPYRKSLAAELHADSIIETTARATDSSKHVHFRLFTGVAPRRFALLFEEKRDLKAEVIDPGEPRHRDFIHSLSHHDFEKRIAEKVDQVVASAEGEAG